LSGYSAGRIGTQIAALHYEDCGNQHEPVHKEGQLGTTFDIFKRLSDGDPLWVAAIEGLEQAKKQTNRLAGIEPGEYFVFSQKKGIVFECCTDAPGIWRSFYR
jgi:hypothetical protein